MAAITWADVVNFAAELSGYPVAAQNDILAHVNTALDVSYFGGETGYKLKLARIFLAAHIAATTPLGGGGGAAGGAITSETVGGVSRSYAAPVNMSGSGYQSTSYGQTFDGLIRTSLARLPLVI